MWSIWKSNSGRSNYLKLNSCYAYQPRMFTYIFFFFFHFLNNLFLDCSFVQTCPVKTTENVYFFFKLNFSFCVQTRECKLESHELNITRMFVNKECTISLHSLKSWYVTFCLFSIYIHNT